MEQIVQKILDTGKITKTDLDEKVKEKLHSLGGLISEEGALHIIANELGVQATSTPSSGVVNISDVTAGMRNVSVLVKVLRKYELRTFGPDGSGKVASAYVGDATGSLRLTFWNDKTSYFDSLQENDVVEIQQAYSRENNGRIELHMGNASHCIVNPEGKTVDVGDRPQTDTPEKKLQDISENDTFVNITATIVQVYDPRFFPIDPLTKKRISEDQITDSSSYNYVMNIFLDDGTSNMRAALWKEQIQQLLNMTDEEIIALKDNKEKLEEVKTDLLGKIITSRARVKKNEAYNNMELVLYQINSNPKPSVSEASSPAEPSAPQAAPTSSQVAVESAAPVAEPAVDVIAEPSPLAKEEEKEEEVVLEPSAPVEAATPASAPSPEVVESLTEELLADDDEEELLSIDDIDEEL